MKNHLMIIAAQDKPGPAEAIDSPMKAESLLGANLVLVASLEQTASQAKLFLRLLDAHFQRVMRKGTVECAISDIGSLAEKASPGQHFAATSNHDEQPRSRGTQKRFSGRVPGIQRSGTTGERTESCRA